MNRELYLAMQGFRGTGRTRCDRRAFMVWGCGCVGAHTLRIWLCDYGYAYMYVRARLHSAAYLSKSNVFLIDKR